MKGNTINKQEIEKFSKLQMSGGIPKESIDHYINLTQQESNTLKKI